jgi:hypothetical protein
VGLNIESLAGTVAQVATDPAVLEDLCAPFAAAAGGGGDQDPEALAAAGPGAAEVDGLVELLLRCPNLCK